MERTIHLVPVKFIISSTMKAKLKATAALNNMTIGDMFMDAVLEKYPFLKNKPTDDIKPQTIPTNLKTNTSIWESISDDR